MKKTLTLILILISLKDFSQSKSLKTELKPLVEFLENNKFLTSKEYILNKFQTKDIVIISERDHRDLTQYEIYIEVVKDSKFKGNIYTEVGACNNYTRINKLLLNSKFSEKEKEKELLSIFRDLTDEVIWDKYNYYYLLNSIFEINKTRKEEDKILLFPLDIEFDWNNIKCHEQYKLIEDYSENSTIDRNIIMGKHFVSFYEFAKKRNPERKKALVIENTYHGYIRIPKFLPLPTTPEIYSTGEYIYKTFPELTTNIYINYYKSGEQGNLTNNGLLDTAFAYTKIDNIGFDLKNTPFGFSKFDLYNFGKDYETENFEFIFDGMIFYKPITEMNIVIGIPNLYPKEYEKQFYKRYALASGTSYKESVINNKKYLTDITTKKQFTLSNSIIKKINEQIDFWLK